MMALKKIFKQKFEFFFLSCFILCYFKNTSAAVSYFPMGLSFQTQSLAIGKWT